MITKSEIVSTEDGSVTIYHAGVGEHYHSTHGAMQESRHIFMQSGLDYRIATLPEDRHSPLTIFEVGFGTGLNALLTIHESEIRHTSIRYYSIEKYPLLPDVYNRLSYEVNGMPDADPLLNKLHVAEWDKDVALTANFTLHKLKGDLLDGLFLRDPIDLIYFDAFSPEAQPLLWEERVFRSLYDKCAEGAVLVTYCAKGEVRRRLGRAGFIVERLAGPPGKREILRAVKPIV